MIWITVACDRSQEKMWIATIAPSRELALSRMRPELRQHEHRAFDVMSVSLRHRLHSWFKELGFSVDEATQMVRDFGKKMEVAASAAAKTSHKSN